MMSGRERSLWGGCCGLGWYRVDAFKVKCVRCGKVYKVDGGLIE